MFLNNAAIGVVLIVFTLVECVSGVQYFIDGVYDSLRITWRPNTRDHLINLPMTEIEAKRIGWTQLNDCTERTAWRGKRYAYVPDFSVVLLYDKYGFIAGMQMGIQNSNLENGFPSKAMERYFIREGDYYFSTVYFLTPEAICTSGRPTYALNTIYDCEIQAGPTPEAKHLVYLPHRPVENSGWEKSECSPDMGIHYFKNLKTSTNCKDYFPLFVLLDPDIIFGFGWILPMWVHSKNSLFELPSLDFVKSYMPTVPNCFNDAQQMTTLHVYLRSNLSAIHC